MVKTKCPKCLPFLVNLEFLDKKIVSETVEKRCYRCKICNTKYERLIMRDSVGLVKIDSVYELDSNGNHLREWK